MADGDNEKMKISLQHALLFLVAGVLLVGMIPAGLLLDRRLVAALEQSYWVSSTRQVVGRDQPIDASADDSEVL